MIINKTSLGGYENAELRRYDDPDCDFPTTCAYDDLGKRTVSGVLKANRYVDGRLMQTYSAQDNHVGIIAATRLGKTTSGIIPMVLSNARKKNKCSMIISDPKAEVYRHTAATLKDEGYRVITINLRNYRHSEMWNPLTPIFRKYQRAQSEPYIMRDCKIVKRNGRQYYLFEGIEYSDMHKLKEAVRMEMKSALDDVYEDIDTFCNMYITVENERDPTWERGARSILKGFIYAMLEDSTLSDNPITEDTFSFDTIFSIFSTFDIGKGCSTIDNGYFSNRKSNSKALMAVKNYLLIGAEGTRDCYISIFMEKMSEYMDIAIRRITSCNSFELTELGKGLVALFICYRDEIVSHYQFVSQFVQEAYKALIDIAGEYPDNKLQTPCYFMLDEFGNFPALYNFRNIISACAGRNIWFVLVLQSYAQLVAVYGQDTSKIILDNLNIKIFFGSNNWPTICEFAEGCGLYTRIAPESALNGDSEEINAYKIETIPLVTKSMLCQLKAGECMVTEANSYVMFSRMERYFNCPEFNQLPLSDEKQYKSAVNPLEPRYHYTYCKRYRD